MTGSGGVVGTLPLPGPTYDQEQESQFRRVLEQALTSLGAELQGRAQDGENGLVFIEGQSVSTPVATVDFTTGIDGTYDEYILILSNIIPVQDDVDLWLRTSTDGGSSWDTGGSDYIWQILRAFGTSVDATNDVFDDRIKLAQGIGSAANENGVSMWVHLVRPSSVAFFTVYAHGMYINAVGNITLIQVGGQRKTAADVDGVRFLFSAANVESGEFRLYGVIKS